MDKKGKLPKDDDWHPLRSAAVASGAGLTMLSSIALGVWRVTRPMNGLGTDPWGLILLSCHRSGRRFVVCNYTDIR